MIWSPKKNLWCAKNVPAIAPMQSRQELSRPKIKSSITTIATGTFTDVSDSLRHWQGEAKGYWASSRDSHNGRIETTTSPSQRTGPNFLFLKNHDGTLKNAVSFVSSHSPPAKTADTSRQGNRSPDGRGCAFSRHLHHAARFRIIAF